MIERTTGIVLRLHPLTETSLIAHWLTPDFGRIATAAKGARRPKSPFRGKLDLFYSAEFTFHRSRRSDLHTLHEVRLLDPHEGLRRDVAYLQQAAYGARLVEQTTETDTPLPTLYSLLAEYVGVLPRQPARAETVLAFEMKLLQELGLSPDFTRTRVTPGTEKILRSYLDWPWPEIIALQVAPAQFNEIRHFLQGFLIYHLGKMPAGRSDALLVRCAG